MFPQNQKYFYGGGWLEGNADGANGRGRTRTVGLPNFYFFDAFDGTATGAVFTSHRHCKPIRRRQRLSAFDCGNDNLIAHPRIEKLSEGASDHPTAGRLSDSFTLPGVFVCRASYR
jgi:hypothetical protein